MKTNYNVQNITILWYFWRVPVCAYSVYYLVGTTACLIFAWLLTCIQSIIVSKTIVIEGGLGPPEVIFIQNGVILGITNGYMCLDDMTQQEGTLHAHFEIYIWKEIYNIIHLFCSHWHVACVGIQTQSRIRVYLCFKNICERSEPKNYLRC